ncbi:MAG: hypothetical protein LBQ84_00665 [Flavobacteriaceae bacterium]|jgi:hypothetical protein|nr:hypothetical protein [Flavobacteriaceae bacterium]
MKKLLLLFGMFLCIISCSSDDNDDIKSKSNSYIGTWKGVFLNEKGTGASENLMSGTWYAIVSQDNKVTGECVYDNDKDFKTYVSGTVDNDGNVVLGTYDYSYQIKDGEFIGKFTLGGQASGTWKNLHDKRYYGTWKGNKQ